VGPIALYRLRKRKVPPFRLDLPLLSLQSELAILIGHLTRIGFLSLTAGILLLLAGLLPAALLLARVLVLLTRVLFLSAHSEVSLCLTSARENGPASLRLPGEHQFLRGHSVAARCCDCGGGTWRKLPLYKTFKPQGALLPPPVPTC
jgi:hypothetical protein